MRVSGRLGRSKNFSRGLERNPSDLPHRGYVRARGALPYLKQTEGCIINIASIFGLVGGPRSAVYSAAKGGIVNLTCEIPVDYASDAGAGQLHLGFVEKQMTDEFLDQESYTN